ncbi:general secretion pathway protein GspK [bacterium]|nr:general secretion pathway protein GspK [bacterium]
MSPTTGRSEAARGGAAAAAPRPLDNERGLALVIVLAVVALLTILVTEFTFNTQLDQHRTRNAVHALQAQLLARSGINLAEGFLMLDEEPAYDAYSEDWFPQMVQFCRELNIDPTMRLRCTVRDESGKINVNNTREPPRRVQGQSVTGSAVLRDAMRCLFAGRGIDVEVVDRLAEYWQQEPPPRDDGNPGVIPDFTSLEDFGATFRISSQDLQKLRGVLTAQPRALLPRINVNTAPREVLAAVLNAEQHQGACADSGTVDEVVQRQRDPDQPFRASGDLNSIIGSLENSNIKSTLFGVQSRLFRLEASALTNVDPDNPDSGGIGQTISILVARQTSLRPRSGGVQQVGSNGKPLPNWTLRPLDWQKEGGARLFRPLPGEDEDQPGTMDEENAPRDRRG